MATANRAAGKASGGWRQLRANTALIASREASVCKHWSRGVRLQAVEGGTGASQNLDLLPRGQRPHPIHHDPQDGVVIAGHGADRPIRADHQAPWAEQLQGNVQVRGEVLRPPPPPIGAVSQSRHFAKDIRAGRQRLQPGLPRPELSRSDVGEAEVVEHETLLGKVPDELHGGGHVSGEDEQVVREAEWPERGDAPLEVVAEEEPLVRLIYDDVAEALDPRVGLEAFQPGGHIRGAQIDPAYNAFNAGVRPRQVEEPLVLVRQLTSLDGDAAVEASPTQKGLEVAGQEGSLQGPEFVCDPHVLAGVVHQEMHVSVKTHGSPTGCCSSDPSLTGRACRAQPLRLADGLGAEREWCPENLPRQPLRWTSRNEKGSPLFEITLVFVRLDHAACFMVETIHSVVLAVEKSLRV